MANTRGTIEIYQGNDTVRRLMSGALTRAGFRVLERDADSPASNEVPDLLVVDVDSGLPDTDARVKAIKEHEKPVLLCGVRSSRERFTEDVWLERPFSKNTFLAQCLLMLEGPTAENFTITKDNDDQITRELQYDEAMVLEAQLGLMPGVLVSDEIVGGGDNADDDEDDVMELDAHGSAILEIADLRTLMNGGQLVGPVAKREVDVSELIQERIDIPRLAQLRTPTFNQTMPDSPIAIGSVDEEPASITTENSIVPPPSDADESRLHNDLHNVSRILAESWNRIGVTARTDDRADRIERILSSLFQGGMRAVTQEVRRIPAGVGFAGSLEAMPAIDLLRTIRDRRLRGRLEISVPEATWVLFVDGATIDDLENLSGSADLQVLDALFALGRLTTAQHAELTQGYATGEFHEPATIKLTQENIVSAEDLLHAQVRCIKDAFKLICAARKGNFAFLEVRQGDGQSWPVRGLRQPIDTLLLEVLRESSFDTGDSRATARTVLVLDAARTAAMAPEALTEEEHAVLKFFRDGERVGTMVEQMSDPELERVVNRLKKLELLKRTNPQLQSPPRHQTVVNPLTDILSRNERRKNASDRDDQTTHMKSSTDIGPDLDEDRLEDIDDNAPSDIPGTDESRA